MVLTKLSGSENTTASLLNPPHNIEATKKAYLFCVDLISKVVQHFRQQSTCFPPLNQINIIKHSFTKNYPFKDTVLWYI